MTHQLEIRTALDDGLVEQLATLLIDAVDAGGLVSFLPPLGREAATQFWRDLALGPRGALVIARAGGLGDDPGMPPGGSAAEGRRGVIDGVVVLAPSWAPNQPHRADVTKLMVHRRARGIGLGRRLMTAIEDHARAASFRLLTLNARRGDVPEQLYRRLGWSDVGVIPDYAVVGDGWCDIVVFYKQLAP